VTKFFLKLYPYLIIILGLGLLVNFFFFYFKFTAPVDPLQVIADQTRANNFKDYQTTSLTIKIEGAVAQPGQYQLFPGQTINDAIILAGGLTAEADLTAAQLDLGSLAENNSAINIPSINQSSDNNPVIIVNNSNNSTKININTAVNIELQKLNGVGEKIAQKIIDYRQSNPFDTIEEIMEVSGIGPKLFEKIKDEITI